MWPGGAEEKGCISSRPKKEGRQLEKRHLKLLKNTGVVSERTWNLARLSRCLLGLVDMKAELSGGMAPVGRCVPKGIQMVPKGIQRRPSATSLCEGTPGHDPNKTKCKHTALNSVQNPGFCHQRLL